MAVEPITFQAIQQKLQVGALTLDQSVLGDKGFTVLSGLFEQKTLASFKPDAQSVSTEADQLRFKGFVSFSTTLTVLFHFCLFDLHSERHAFIKIELPPETYLKSSQAQSRDQSSETMLDLYVKEIGYAQPAMIFSSLDDADGFDKLYPSDFRAIVPARQIKTGLNFPLEKIEFDNGFIGYFEKVFAGKFETGQEYGLIRQMKSETGSLAETQKTAPPIYFIVSQLFKSDALKLGSDLWGMTLERFALGFPLVEAVEIWPQAMVYGSVHIGGQTLSFNADYNIYHGVLALTFRGFPSLKTLLSTFCNPDEYFPGPLANLLEVYLSRLQIVLDMRHQDNRVVEISLCLTTEREIVLVEHLVALKPILDLQIQYPFASEMRQLEGTLSGIWQLGDTKFITSLSYPYYNLYAAMMQGQKLDVGALAEKVFGITLPKIEINQMELNGNFVAKSFAFELGITSDWELPLWGANKLRLKQLQLSMSYIQRPSPLGAQWQRQYRIVGFLELAGVELYVSAQYIGPGWQFQGSLGRNKPVQLNKLIQQFGQADLPGPLQKIQDINYLDVTFNTESKDFTFVGEVKFPLNGKELDLTLIIEITRQQDGLYNKHFSGTLKVDGRAFNVIFDSKTNATTFIAAYSDPTGQSTKIKDLVAVVYPDNSIPESLSFTLKDALFAYQNQTGVTPPTKYLFGLDIDGGLNLSDLHLDDLPLLNTSSSPNQTIKLSFQVLVQSSPFSRDDIQALNALLPPGPNHLPLPTAVSRTNGTTTAVIDKTLLNVTLRLGGQSKQLPLNIGAPIGDSSQPSLPSIPTQALPLPQTNDGTQWVTIQRTFGPLHVEKVGVNYKADKDTDGKETAGKVSLMLNASLTAGGLTIALQGLKATSPLDTLKPTFGLDGLGIEYQNDAIEIAGAFLRTTDSLTKSTQFAGLAMLRTQALSLSAIGAFSKTASGGASLFLYAVLDYPLGGPPFFFVTGLAAGFGYNRALTTPTIEQVASFPLVTQAMGSPTPLPGTLAEQQTRLTSELASLNRFVPINVGQTFLAVGIKFTTFKMMESFALLMVQFGNRTEIAVLGLSTLIVPTPKEGESLPALAEAQLALKAIYIPADGFLGVEAQLTAASYIFSHDCHITGGFAFYSWLSGPHAGDFVLTLGGYHPHFRPPDHYPQRVPRLGINWRISDNLSITGQAYYALTAHALMAGGMLVADYHSDWVHAWFKAGADFLLTWQPYHYEVSLYISLGAEVSFGAIHISFDAGADLTLWGPPFGGHANVHLWICGFKVSFDIDFGSGHGGAKPIAWTEFKRAFLPADNQQVCSIVVQQGLLRQITEGNEECWIINPQAFVLVTNSVIPAMKATIKDEKLTPLQDKDGHPIISSSPLAIQPMGIKYDELVSTHSITITHDGNELKDLQNHFIFQPVLKKVPAGMWGMPIIDKDGFLEKPKVNAESFVDQALCGLVISPKPPKPSSHTHSMDQSNFQYDTTDHEIISWGTPKAQTFNPYNSPEDNDAAWRDVQAGIVKNSERGTLLQELGLENAVIDFGQPVDQFAVSAPQVADSI